MRNVLRTLPVLLALAAPACSLEDPLYRQGTWRPEGLNQRNLQAMVADKRDLQGGASAATDRASGAGRAVTRLLTDHRRPLLNSTLSRIGGPVSDAPDTPLPSPGGGGGGAPVATGVAGATP